MTAKDGKPCKRCGTSEWDKNSDCKECAKERKRKWAQTNRDKERKRARQWERDNPEKERERKRRWEQKNPDKARERRKRWEQNNPDSAAERRKRWEQENPQKARERDRRWRESNPEKVRAYTHRRRATKKGNGGSYTEAEWREVVRQQDGRCLACGKKCKLTIDHVLPISMGGSNDISNIQGLCLSCNSSKKDRHIDYRPESKGIKRWIQRRLFNE